MTPVKKAAPPVADEALSETIHIKDLTPDPHNAREHTARNVGLIVNALHEVGAARSIVIDENGVIMAGNATVEAAAEAGLYKVRVVESAGDEIIAVRRRNLSPEQKTRLALYDNRAGELSKWNEESLRALAERGQTRDLWSVEELTVMLEGLSAPDPVEPPDAFAAVDDTLATSFCCPRCHYEWSGSPRPGEPASTDVGSDDYDALKSGPVHGDVDREQE